MDCCEQYVRVGAEEALKSPEIAEFPQWFILKLLHPAQFDPEHTLYLAKVSDYSSKQLDWC
jgi:hypothetical protein